MLSTVRARRPFQGRTSVRGGEQAKGGDGGVCMAAGWPVSATTRALVLSRADVGGFADGPETCSSMLVLRDLLPPRDSATR